MNQQEALDILKLGYNVYLTGSAGSGKTFLLNKYIDYLQRHGVPVGITASTGIAATHMSGMTIHSWSGIGVREKLTDNDLIKISKNRNLARRLEKTKVLVIDEVSMLHSFQLDMVDKICRFFKQPERPFGGMQVVLCGDFFQLPPVSQEGKKVKFINQSDIWQKMNLKICYLSEQYRQRGGELENILNDIRSAKVGEHTLTSLRKRYKKEVRGAVNPTRLYTHNLDVDFINNQELKKLGGRENVYLMSSGGSKKMVSILKRGCLAPEELRLKKGASVMFIKNNSELGYVNGTLGIVAGFSSDGLPIVQTLEGKKINVFPENWRIEEEGKERASIRQIPLRLAWAITVHKSQGMTLDAAEIDLSKSFVEGMGYVALSRLRFLDGLKLLGLNELALKVSGEALELDKLIQEASGFSVQEINKIFSPAKVKMQKNFLRSIALRPGEARGERVSTYEKTKLLINQKFSIEEIANRRNLSADTIVTHLEKMLAKGEKLDLNYLKLFLPPDRFAKIKTAFKETGGAKLSPVKEILGSDFSYEEIRLTRLFLRPEQEPV